MYFNMQSISITDRLPRSSPLSVCPSHLYDHQHLLNCFILETPVPPTETVPAVAGLAIGMSKQEERTQTFVYQGGFQSVGGRIHTLGINIGTLSNEL